jgi:predicted RNA-binding Zn ribbon-like protein
MQETPTAATMRLDGGHPALELVNTVYGQVGGPVEHDVLAEPGDLVTLAARLRIAGPTTPADPAALAAARRLRDALDPVLRSLHAGVATPADALATVGAAARGALDAGHLVASAGTATWSWPDDDPHSPVHRLAHAAVGLLGDAAELTRLGRCAACRWLFLDHSRGAGRRWCSMADCGTEAKKRRYVARRRELRAARAPRTAGETPG